MNKKEWLQCVNLYVPDEQNQIILPQQTSCVAVKTFLKMCNIDYEIEERRNAEYMAPGGRFTKLPVYKAGLTIVSEFEPIVKAVLMDVDEANIDVDKETELYRIENVLTLAEYFICYKDKKVYEEYTQPRTGIAHPWPLRLFYLKEQKAFVEDLLYVHDWSDLDIPDVCLQVENVCDSLNYKLEENKGKFIYSDEPNELDALAFGHLNTILSTDLPNNILAKTVSKYTRLTDYCKFIEKIYFKEE